MKRLVLTAAVLVLASCASGEKAADTSRTDTAAAMAPAPMDTAMKMDSATHEAMLKDSAAKAKETKKTP